MQSFVMSAHMSLKSCKVLKEVNIFFLTLKDSSSSRQSLGIRHNWMYILALKASTYTTSPSQPHFLIGKWQSCSYFMVML
jgi:hypothetical protein